MKNGISATLAVALLAGVASAQVSTVAQWNLQGTLGNQATQAGIGSAAASASVISRGAGLVATPANNSFNSRGWDSVGATDYVSFGFTVNGGMLLDLVSLRVGTRSSAEGPGNLGLFYSGDGFTTNLFAFAQPSEGFVNNSIDLTSLPNVGGLVEFRIVALNNTAANGGAVTAAGTFRLGAFNAGTPSALNMQFTAAPAFPVPTPGALALLGCGGLFISRRRRA